MDKNKLYAIFDRLVEDRKNTVELLRHGYKKLADITTDDIRASDFQPGQIHPYNDEIDRQVKITAMNRINNTIRANINNAHRKQQMSYKAVSLRYILGIRKMNEDGSVNEIDNPVHQDLLTDNNIIELCEHVFNEELHRNKYVDMIKKAGIKRSRKRNVSFDDLMNAINERNPNAIRDINEYSYIERHPEPDV